MEQLYKLIVDNFELLSLIITLLGLFISIIMTFLSLRKQMSHKIYYEQLNYVYFPLLTAINQFKGATKGFDLYWLLKDKIIDEKYRTLLGSNKTAVKIDNLIDYYSIEQPFDYEKDKQLFIELYSLINKKYISLKMSVGYESIYESYANRYFIVFYLMFIILAISYKFVIHNISDEYIEMFTNTLMIFILLDILFLYLSFLFYVLAFLYGLPLVKNNFHKTLSKLKTRYKNKR